MKENVHFNETDIALLEALRVNVRAPWASIGKAIGVDGVTARRRWSRIVGQNLAWTTVSTGNWRGQLTAVITLQCRVGTATVAGYALAELPQVMTIETIIGRHDLRCVVVVRDLEALNRLMSEDLGRIPGLLTSESQLVGTVYRQGSSWRAGALTPTAERSLSLQPGDHRLFSHRPHQIDAPMTELLIMDARMPANVIAEKLKVSETLIRRRLNSLINTGLLVLRAEAAPHLVSLPYSANLWLSFSRADLDRAAATLSSFKETRWTVSVLAGPANLYCSLWFRELEQLNEIERQLEMKFPGFTVVDRSMRLKAIKRMMHVLDENGLSKRIIPWVPQNSSE